MEDIAVDRVLERSKTSGREEDKNAPYIKKRISKFNEETMPVIEYYKGNKKLAKINGENTPDGVYRTIKRKIKEKTGI